MVTGFFILDFSDIFVVLICKTLYMNKRSWFIPVMIVAIHALAIISQWNSLENILPAHFDLQGNASGTMPRSVLIWYPVIGAVICLIARLIAKLKSRLQTGLIILSSGICLVLLFSTMVTLTSGTMPVFMLAEPVILLAAVVAFIVCAVKAMKS